MGYLLDNYLISFHSNGNLIIETKDIELAHCSDSMHYWYRLSVGFLSYRKEQCPSILLYFIFRLSLSFYFLLFSFPSESVCVCGIDKEDCCSDKVEVNLCLWTRTKQYILRNWYPFSFSVTCFLK